MQSESPEYVRLSTAADIALGFSTGPFWRNAQLYCINLLLHYEDGCKANCLYCGQARGISRGASCRSLIRVEWPLRKLDDVIERARRLLAGGDFLRPYRVCVASITNVRAVEGEMEVVERLWDELRIPISALISPTMFYEHHIKQLRDVGAERVGIAVDCATRNIFEMLRGRKAGGAHRWERYIQGVREAVRIMGMGKVGVHLMIGLGEAEEEAVEFIQWVHDVGAETHLFSFYPEELSVMEGWPRPPIGQYRRIQMARYLIDHEISRYDDFKFDSLRRIVDFGVAWDELVEISLTGRPFMTSGCPGCNRPYANERPGEIIRNYPFVPTRDESMSALMQLRLYSHPYNSSSELGSYLLSKDYG